MRRRSIGLISCWFAVGVACAGQSLSADRAAQIYAQATNQFKAAIFYKPVQATNAGLSSQFAPIIMQEVAAPRASNASPQGTIGVSELPPVFWFSDTVEFNGKSYARISYQWDYPARKAVGDQHVVLRQGFRVTLDTRGQPVAWEILADTSGLRLIFVSQSLEAGASAQFGKPLAGRRYSIEQSLEQAPRTIVPRVLDDGPLPMGPIIYLAEGTRNVATLICRCMPAQVKQLVATRTFELLPLGTEQTHPNTPPALWLDEDRAKGRLDKCLRLPKSF
jgi:hypothetical protein